MELMHFVQAPGSKRIYGHAQHSLVVCDGRGMSCVELESGIGEILQSLNLIEGSAIASMPWLQAVLIVSPQSSDDLSLKLLNAGIVVLEAPKDESVEQIVEGFEQQLQRFQGAWMHEPATSRAKAAHQNPTAPGAPTSQNQESPFSKTPAYFSPTLYNEWVGKLSEPWRKEDPWDSDS